MRLSHLTLFTLSAALAVLLPRPSFAQLVTTSIGGDNTTASIQATVDSFRAALGDPNNGNTPGPLAGGRREINWDGGGSTVAAPAPSTFDGFLNGRGARFTTPGTGFLQTPVDATALTDINPTYATTFSAFSPVRIFTSLGSNITDVTFFLPGTAGGTAATVSGFGAIFTDVDLANTTFLTFYDSGGSVLLNSAVEVGTVADGSFSFLGAVATGGEQIARVRITAGNTALGPNDGGNIDVVATDDFFHAEPLAVAAPEPGSVALLLPIVGLFCFARRRLLVRA